MKTFAEVFETLPGTGWLSKNEAAMLYWHCALSEGPILEVGCYYGRSTVLLASFNRPLYCVDPFDRFDSEKNGDEIEAIWQENMRSRGLLLTCTIREGEIETEGHVILYRQPIEEWEARPVGFAYLDGDHTYQGTLDQIAKAQECGAKVIAVHDVNDSGGGLEVKRAAVETLGAWTDRTERLAVWIIK